MTAALKKSQAMRPAKSPASSIDRRTLLRLALTLITLLAVAAAIFLAHSSHVTREQTREATMTRGWKSARPAVAATNAKPSIDAVMAQWSMRRDTVSGQASLVWTVSDSRDVQASLLALDAAQIRAQRIEIRKRESGFAVSAELAP
jgi:hypothetical protein